MTAPRSNRRDAGSKSRMPSLTDPRWPDRAHVLAALMPATAVEIDQAMRPQPGEKSNGSKSNRVGALIWLEEHGLATARRPSADPLEKRPHVWRLGRAGGLFLRLHKPGQRCACSWCLAMRAGHPSRAGALRVLGERATRDTADPILQALDALGGVVGLGASPRELGAAIRAARATRRAS